MTVSIRRGDESGKHQMNKELDGWIDDGGKGLLTGRSRARWDRNFGHGDQGSSITVDVGGGVNSTLS